MKYVKVLIENVYLVDPDSLKIIYSPHMDWVINKNNLENRLDISELFDAETYSLLKCKIPILMLDNGLEEITMIVNKAVEQKGSDMFSIRIKKIKDLSNLLLEIKVGRMKKLT
jgi:hypothetical protein